MKRLAQVARRIAGLEKSAAIDDPPTKEDGCERLRHTPPERKKEGSEAKQRKQEPKGFFLRVQKSVIPGERWLTGRV